MILVRISGGLGNQMFQYALARMVKEKNAIEVKLDIDSFAHLQAHEAPRSFRLDVFNITLSVATEEDKKNSGLNTVHQKNVFTLLQRKLQVIIDKSKSLNQKKFILEPSFSFHPEMLNPIRDNSFISGVWQSEKYFTNIGNILREEFTLKKSLSPVASLAQEQILSSQGVSIHIRRGDYLTNAKTKPLSLEYYKKAVTYIHEHVQNPHFFVFSDDIEWVKQNLPLTQQTTYVSNPNIADSEELILMSNCKHSIIANSSFSWWAAWLNNNHEKIVIAPENWFSVDISTKDLIPETWIRL